MFEDREDSIKIRDKEVPKSGCHPYKSLWVDMKAWEASHFDKSKLTASDECKQAHRAYIKVWRKALCTLILTPQPLDDFNALYYLFFQPNEDLVYQEYQLDLQDSEPDQVALRELQIKIPLYFALCKVTSSVKFYSAIKEKLIGFIACLDRVKDAKDRLHDKSKKRLVKWLFHLQILGFKQMGLHDFEPILEIKKLEPDHPGVAILEVF